MSPDKQPSRRNTSSVSSQTLLQQQEFMERASHDVKSLLTSMKAYVQLLERELLKTRQKKALLYASKIDGQVNKVTKLMSSIVDVFRIKAGKLELSKEDFSLTQLLNEVIGQMQAIAKQNISFNPTTKNIMITADKTRFMQAVRNILHNAILFSPESSAIQVVAQTKSNSTTIYIEDFGKGIPDEKMQIIFDPFLQSRSGNSLGLGTGVFIASSIIHAHGGEFTIESRAEKGTKVWIRLPNRYRQ